MSDLDTDTMSRQEDNDSDTGAASVHIESKVATAEVPMETEGEPAKEKRKIRRRPPFQETHLVSASGLEKIYQTFPSKCRNKGSGQQLDYLRNLMHLYKEWGYQLYSPLAFEDLAGRIEKMGSKTRIKNFVEDLRQKEMARHLDSSYGSDVAEAMRLRREEARAAAIKAKEGKAQEQFEDTAPHTNRYASQSDSETNLEEEELELTTLERDSRQLGAFSDAAALASVGGAASGDSSGYNQAAELDPVHQPVLLAPRVDTALAEARPLADADESEMELVDYE